jgi:F0F1-type ATP synthase membrane subunit a
MSKKQYWLNLGGNIFAMLLNYTLVIWDITSKSHIWMPITSFIAGTFSLSVALWFGITQHKYIKRG